MLDILWIIFVYFFLLAFLWPYVRQRMIHNERMNLIRRLELTTRSHIITMIHRQERVSLFGIPIYRYIDIEDSEQVLRAVRTTPPDVPITMIIHTPGGLVLAAAQIAMALKAHPAKKTVIVPHYAMSGGTLIALAADEIIMDPYAVLGPLDPQLSDPKMGAVPAVSVLRVVKEKGIDKVSDETLIKADVAEKAIKQIEELVVELVQDKLGKERAEQLAKTLVYGTWTHDYPLTVKKLRELGLPVKTEVPPEVYRLMELYPQAQPIRPSVEYIPSPYYPPQPPPRRTAER
ncbi:MAG: ATP-dependent Clp protease proteolytic subunit [Candidatus Verstraetearchaeota archaeon]|nr:ATP-dependent Clp protease proteolytic subunit [Candidatus Verstraetearchaeota archaeon]